MDYTIDIVERPQQTAAVVHGHAGPEHIAEFVGRAFGAVARLVEHEGLTYAGAPFGRYVPTSDGFDIDAGFPVTGDAVAEGEVELITLPAGPAAHTVHTGPYAEVGAAYEATGAWLHEHGYRRAGAPWEVYLDGPDIPLPRTELFWPVRPAADGS
ncbi:MAG: GyrI-like domain-containing protein [Jatrophihabitans sp.]|uniref:GyrI-like domain-containing protein n=1 Tax=Jatrophihabitans sp. TaxID=1932789 RepID=UPI003F7FFC00